MRPRRRGNVGRGANHLRHPPPDAAHPANVLLSVEPNQVLDVRHGLVVVGDDRRPVRHVARHVERGFERPDDGDVDELAGDAHAGS